ncbi:MULTISPECIES: hypothetical protein [unclassified Curtobacterium]|uniref:hypothetical protein n=1 Tax=unclassified Curtobacterium TaxID=257496 RepID=UPI000F484A8E|nr:MULTISPECIES: hypothetical protein [unclassified Curtobacterium]ROQ18706.1 hypothetical protein EDF41_0027 [Curtobacterium sp. PhB171]ROQ18972.1 hypothetical protein EDF40_3770 [Curtobacterium sp. PhB170]ROS32484.1 hypothetical protein EDF25_3657 [Curtobacterium sp. PhB131]ROS74200.1 hypothetical protein EDF30_0089 [Curtobacterium sp. PhB141]
MGFLDAVGPAADAAVARLRLTDDDPAALQHRELMARALTLVGAWVRNERTGGPDRLPDDDLATAHGWVRHLAARQSPGGTFVGGDNVLSPPDSAFTVNDVCDALELLAPYRASVPAAAVLADDLDRIVHRATPALLTGGVHTPNHRWEVSAALARVHRLHPAPELVARIDQWLAERADIDADGLWSERSPNYAAAVSCPSFLVLASVLDRPELLDPVRRSLDATLALLLPDDTVETVQSRRQDQSQAFGIGAFAPLLWHLAVLDDRADLAAVAARAADAETWQPGAVAARAMTDPLLARPLPVGAPLEPAVHTFADARLVHVREQDRSVVLFAGSDVPSQGHVRSGLANSPTFLRVFAGSVALTDVRLSREFFGLGPFRPTSLESLGDGRYRLTETVSAGYHQPLPAAARRTDGAYALGDEGRFSASMSFGARAADTVSLTTTVDVTVTPDAVSLDVTTEGADVPWSLQLTFRGGGTFTGVSTDAATGETVLAGGTGTYRVGDDAVSFGVGNGSGPTQPAFYAPGQDYAFLGGTDRPDGEHVHVTGRSPGTTRITIGTAR